MSGTYVARGDVGGIYKLADRTRESVGKNTGLNRFKFVYLHFIEISSIYNRHII